MEEPVQVNESFFVENLRCDSSMTYVKNLCSLKAFKGKGWPARPAHPATNQVAWASPQTGSLGTWANGGINAA